MNGNNEILLSIITVAYNCIDAVKKTMTSVLMQPDSRIEYIVVDGASADGTASYLKECASAFTFRYRWISESDSGIYNAMNKGLSLASGKYVMYLNADDTLCKEALIKILSQIQIENADIIYGDSVSEYVYDEQIIYRYKSALEEINMATLKEGMGCVHQCIVTKKELLQSLDGFKEKYKVGADWDFLIRAAKQGAILSYCRYPFCVYNREGFSAKSHIRERHIIRKDNQMYNIIDINYVKDYFCIADMIKRVLGQKFYIWVEQKNSQRYKQESDMIKRTYISYE